jgi:hypothetical protein
MTTERWNDTMLDELAESVEQTNYNLELLVGAVSGLLEQSRQSAEDSRRRDEEFRQYKLENDQRFTVLLEEVRFLIRQLGENR